MTTENTVPDDHIILRMLAFPVIHQDGPLSRRRQKLAFLFGIRTFYFRINSIEPGVTEFENVICLKRKFIAAVFYARY